MPHSPNLGGKRRTLKNAAAHVNLFGGVVTAPFFGLMSWQFVRFAAEAVATGERMPVMRWPTGPWWWAVTLFIALTAVVGAVVVTSPSETTEE